MKILWVSSSPIGPASRILELPYGGSSGTWIQTEYESLKDNHNVTVSFLCPVKNFPTGYNIKKVTEEGTAYGIGFSPAISFGRPLPQKVINSVQEVIREVRPDVIHIWGSESSFSAGIASLKTDAPKVIFIQGLIGIHHRYMGIKNVRDFNKYYRLGILDKIRYALKNKYYSKHIVLEQKAIRNAKNVITDNKFTEAYCNSFAHVMFHKHFLYPNNIFYSQKWDIERIERNTIFTIFSSEPSKGLSQLLKAVKLVKNSVPDIKLYIPGPFNITPEGTINPRRCSPFERWIYEYIKKNRLSDNVFFTGRLDANGMLKHYLSCNVFVSPSAMEVHSSSVREAMAVGVPTISSLCGSVNEYITHNINGLIYRFEEEEVLAMLILKILNDDKFACSIGEAARSRMEIKSDEDQSLIDIYEKLVDE